MKSQITKICQLSFLFVGSLLAQTQQSIGTVGMQDATVAGALEVTNGRAILVGNTTVTARDRTAEIELGRGGAVRVCATSGLHVMAGKSADGTAAAPLMLALDRGAIEVQMAATSRDVHPSRTSVRGGINASAWFMTRSTTDVVTASDS